MKRPRTGLLLGPALAVLTYAALALDADAPARARTVAAVGVLMVTWWMTEALPLPVTSFIPLIAFPTMDVFADPAAAAAPYAHPLVLLAMGGFMIAIAMQRWNLHTRTALLIVRAIGTEPRRLVLGVMVATAFVSLWVSNTATTLMMVPIGMSLLSLLDADESADPREVRKFGACLMLGIAYAASIGGLGTIIGTPTNGVVVDYAERSLHTDIGMLDWMKLGIPLVLVFVPITWYLLTHRIFPIELERIAGSRDYVNAELTRLGRMSRAEWTVLTVFITTVLLWILSGLEAVTSAVPPLAHLDDTSIAIAAALALFLIPVPGDGTVLDWKSVERGMPWGVLFLCGGSLSLAAAIRASQLDHYLATGLTGLASVPTIVLVSAVVIAVVLLTQMNANTPTAATFVPVVGGVAAGNAIAPMLLVLPAGLAASCAFMLPAGTPPNAIVMGTGRLELADMIRAGVRLNITATLLVIAAVYLLGPWAFGITL